MNINQFFSFMNLSQLFHKIMFVPNLKKDTYGYIKCSRDQDLCSLHVPDLI